MPMVDLSVIAPCLDEEGNVQELVSRTLQTFDTAGINGQLLLVDDGSTDATWARIQACAARDVRVIGVQHPQNRGIVSAWLSGLQASSGERVCLIDSDLQNRPEDIARLAAAHVKLNDVVQAVRHPSRGVRRLYYFSRSLNLLLNVAFHMRLRDNKSGFVLCRKEVLSAVLEHRFAYKYFQCFIGASAAALGLQIIEIDTSFDERRSGHSFLARMPLGPSVRIIWEILKFRVETLTRTHSDSAMAVPKSI
jgi:glycosyltransferase involved in cell wall biosynthesis